MLQRFDPAAAPPLSGAGRALLSWRALAVAVALVAITMILFGFAPELDLGAAGAFYVGGNRFVGEVPLGTVFRWLLRLTPYLVLAALAGAWAARRGGLRVPLAPSTRGLVFLVLTLALGPGLLVNVVLKDHAHRPRPVQVTEFGGTMPFRPVGDLGGACRRNCSFVSGEGSLGFWTLAPALLTPPGVQPLALAAAALLGVAMGLLRMAFGGHFLSDTILAALSSWIVISLVWRLLFRRGAEHLPPRA